MSEMEDSPSLLNLPDDVICVLLRYLDATTLYFLAKTCSRLDALIKGYFTLWKRIDARRAPYSDEKIQFCLERCYDDGNSGTGAFLIRGDANETPTLSFFSKINLFSKLTILAVENMTIDGKYDVTVFPRQLHELSLRRTEVDNSSEFFRGSSEYFTSLRVLILDECNWLFSSAFMPICKYKNLEILSVYKCRSLKNSVAYLSLSSHGFKSLKILDARLSLLGNGLIRAVYKIESLLALYFQNEDISYQLDYFKRKLALVKGAPPRNFIAKDDEFDVKKQVDFPTEDTGTVDDIGLLDYLLVHSGQKKAKLPKSYLYKDPYNVCTCGFDDNQKKNFNNGDDNFPADDGDYSHQLRHISNKIDLLKAQLLRCQPNVTGRGLCSYPTRTRSPSTVNYNEINRLEDVIIMEVINRELPLTRVEEPENRTPRRHPDSDSDTEEPPRKVPRCEEPTAGPSGLNARGGTPVEAPQLRPPTPRPEIVYDPPVPRNAYRVYFRDWGVRFESIDESRQKKGVSLQRLSLRGYDKVTDSGLKYIKDLDLELLDLTYTNVTVDGIEGYLRSHPLCRIVHEKYCTCPTNLHF